MGVTVNETDHTVSLTIPNPIQRPTNGPWDIGAYQYSGVVQDIQAPIINNIVTSAITSSSATISWTTDESSDSQVVYSTDLSFNNSTVKDQSFVTSHSQSLTNLSPSTLYNFKVRSSDAAGNITFSPPSNFTTAAVALQPDITAPIASITSPTPGTVSGTITFSATASDPVVGGQVTSGVNLITLYIDGAVYATSSSTSISKSLDTTTLTNGPHSLYPQSRDNAGNLSLVALTRVDITVNNQVAQKFPRTIQLTSLEGIASIPANQAITATILSGGGTVLETQSNLTPIAGKYTITFLSSDPQMVNIRVKATGYLSQLLSNIDTTVNSAAVISVPQLLAGDFDNNNTVNTIDNSLLNTHWNQNFPTADINKDNLINSQDYAILKNNWNRVGQ